MLKFDLHVVHTLFRLMAYYSIWGCHREMQVKIILYRWIASLL